MEIKCLEIRDRATFIPAMAIRFTAKDDRMIRAAGYGFDDPSTILIKLEDGKGSSDPFKWGDRTMTTAHNFIQDNFEILYPDDVIDVEFILGETTVKKAPQYLEISQLRGVSKEGR